MKVECIDDSNKPNEIRDINWVKKGREYTVIGVNSHPFQSNVKSFMKRFYEVKGSQLPKHY